MALATITATSDAAYFNTITFAGVTFSKNNTNAVLNLQSGQLYPVSASSDQGRAILRISGNCLQFEDGNDNDFNDLIVCTNAGNFVEIGGTFYFRAPYDPPTVSISLSKTSIVRDGSDSSVLTWSASGADILTVSVTGQTNPGLTGSSPVRPTTTTTYTITATNPGGSSSASVTLTVLAPPLPNVNISLNKPSIVRDGSDSAQLSWSATGVISSITVTDQTNPGPSGNVPVRPTNTRTYTITATNESGSRSASVTLTVLPPPLPSASISLNKSSIINNGTDSAILTWSASGAFITSITVTDQFNPSLSGSNTVRPTSTRTYTISVTNESGTTSRSVTLTVYQIPVVTLSLSKNPIIIGETATLSWTTTGDATSISITPGISNQNLNSFALVSPTDATTYFASVSGPGGSDTDSITLRVYQRPTVSINAPTNLNYNQQGTITYSASYADLGLKITPTYSYDDGVVTGSAVNLPRSSSAEANRPGVSVSGSIPTAIPYNNTGPNSVTYLIEATGSGGIANNSVVITINIDRTPDNVIIPETEDVFKSQNPIVTPDTTIVSAVVEILDIDIPVEVKADRPIQVDVNRQNTWKNLRQL